MLKGKAAMLKRALLINDLSGYGKCSLTTALPILSAFGVECVTVPTAVLSSHTGIDRFVYTDLSERFAETLDHYRRMSLKFELVYTGFFSSRTQTDHAANYLNHLRFWGAKILVDPVMGDNGKIYATYSRKLCDGIRALVRGADIITPNLTETAILLGEPYVAQPDRREIEARLRKLAALGPGTVVITGVIAGETTTNYIYTRSNGIVTAVETEYIQSPYCGTGDLFASVLAGGVLAGAGIENAVRKAAEFVRDAIVYSLEAGASERDGLRFEPLLRELIV